ncbi:Retrovirus-related Pol polyprotein from transposon RE2 [Sesamum angolense]|uniref:Retrovirus-related Pol polyprotein from transposon RE2 n=1 Tax=Sesamum angolense TaxID=2727404 RepID=A0AAE2BVD8_9LAMI|nr:Retrovirus-related Pol polyprotein from transposon RE2 [Sesamum angolense]
MLKPETEAKALARRACSELLQADVDDSARKTREEMKSVNTKRTFMSLLLKVSAYLACILIRCLILLRYGDYKPSYNSCHWKHLHKFSGADREFLQLHGADHPGMVLEIVEGFMYTKSSRILWLDLEERYGTCNGPLLYQLQREITTLSQGNMSVVDYYTKLRKLMQFLMGLGEIFDHVRNQLLVMDPIPSVNRAYSMVQSVEKQRQVHMEMTNSEENIAMQVRAGVRKEVGFRGNQYKRNIIDKRQQYCTHCDRSGHTKDTCFKIHGIGEINERHNTCAVEPQQQVNFAQFDDFAVPDIDSPDESLPSTSPSIHISPSSSDTSTSVPPPLPVSPAPRRSLRTTSKPIWLSDYVCSCTETSITCSPDTYSLAHISFVAQISSVQEPKTYLQASFDPHWIKAMDQELQALETNGTWELTSLPPKKKQSDPGVFKLKYNPDGSIERYKARLVAKGYNQIEGVDYFDSFSPVAKSVTVRVFLAIAVSKSWPLFQLTSITHFYMDTLMRKFTWILLQDMLRHNLAKCANYVGPSMALSRLHDSGDNFVALLVYVDDILLTGLELTRSSHGLHVTQHKYLQDILLDASMTDAKPASTPFPPGLKLTLDGGSLLPSPDRYRRLVGRLLYLGFTRPDISFPVQQLSQFLQSPRTTHWDAALHILRYLRGSSSLGLFFSSRSSLQLSAFSDAAWASCLDSRRSITGFAFFLDPPLGSKKQATVSRSSAEAEYRSMASTVSELLWISYLLRDFQLSIQQPIPFWCDNKAALHITANPVFHERTKHLDIDCHLVRDQFKAGFISPTHIAGPHQPADLFTKAVPSNLHTFAIQAGLGFPSAILRGADEDNG